MLTERFNWRTYLNRGRETHATSGRLSNPAEATTYQSGGEVAQENTKKNQK